MAFRDNLAGQHNIDLELMNFDLYTDEAYEKLDPELRIGHQYTRLIDIVLRMVKLPMNDEDPDVRANLIITPFQRNGPHARFESITRARGHL